MAVDDIQRSNRTVAQLLREDDPPDEIFLESSSQKLKTVRFGRAANAVLSLSVSCSSATGQSESLVR